MAGRPSRSSGLRSEKILLDRMSWSSFLPSPFTAGQNKAGSGYYTNFVHELTFHGIVYSNSVFQLHYLIWIA